MNGLKTYYVQVTMYCRLCNRSGSSHRYVEETLWVRVTCCQCLRYCRMQVPVQMLSDIGIASYKDGALEAYLIPLE